MPPFLTKQILIFSLWVFNNFESLKNDLFLKVIFNQGREWSEKLPSGLNLEKVPLEKLGLKSICDKGWVFNSAFECYPGWVVSNTGEVIMDPRYPRYLKDNDFSLTAEMVPTISKNSVTLEMVINHSQVSFPKKAIFVKRQILDLEFLPGEQKLIPLSETSSGTYYVALVTCVPEVIE